MSRLLPLLMALLLLAAACGSGGGAGDTTASEADGDVEVPHVVATTTILGDIVGQLAGDAVEVTTLIPVGADSHSFQLSTQQGELIRDADLVVANGLGLEEGLLDALESAGDDGIHVFEATSAVEVIPFGEAGGHEHDEHEEGEEHADEEGEAHADEEDEHADEDGHDHDHDGGDPHFWMDPARMADVVEELGHELAELDTALSEEEWDDRADALADELDALSDEVAEILADVPEERRVLVTNHEALGYFADAFDMAVLGTVVPGGDTLAEPSAADLEELVDAITDAGVSAIFAETSSPSRLAEVVAEEVDGDVIVAELFTESLSDADGPAATYQDFMRHNATVIADSLA